MPPAGREGGGGGVGAGPGRAAPMGAFHGLAGVAVCGGVVVGVAPPLLAGGCSGPTGAEIVPGIAGAGAVKPAAAAAATAGSIDSLGPSGVSGSKPGLSGGGNDRSCVTLGS